MSFEIGRSLHTTQLLREVGYLLGIGEVLPAAETVLRMPLDAEAAREIQSPLEVILQALVKGTAIHIKDSQIVLEFPLE